MNKPHLLLSFALLLLLLLPACASPPQTFGPPEDYAQESRIPVLEVPPGARLFGGGGGGASGIEGLGLDFQSDLGLAAIHAHFAAQLEATGWSEVEQQIEDGQMITFWELVDEDGKSWAAKLDVHLLSASTLDEYKMEIKLLLPR